MPAALVPFVLDWHSTSVAEAACIEVKENDFSAQAMGSLRAAERPGRFPLPFSSGFNSQFLIILLNALKLASKYKEVDNMVDR